MHKNWPPRTLSPLNAKQYTFSKAPTRREATPSPNILYPPPSGQTALDDGKPRRLSPPGLHCWRQPRTTARTGTWASVVLCRVLEL
jgi:hypothetical protein